MSTSPAYVTFGQLALACGLEAYYATIRRRKGGWSIPPIEATRTEFGRELIERACGMLWR